MEENENNVIAYCEECGDEITRDSEECYVDEEGHYFDSIECLLEYFHITKLEM